jgi:hypothetical protein
MNAIERAIAVVDQLETRRSQHIAAGEKLSNERDEIALTALTAGGAPRKRLDELHAALAKHGSELAALDAALTAANRRVADLRAVEQQAQAREVARELLKRAARLVQLGQTLDDANSIRIEASNAIADELTEMRSLAHGLGGVHIPSHEQFLALGSRADQTATMGSAFARVVGEHLAPRERRTHQSYLMPWSDQIVEAARAVMGDKQEAA